MRAFDVLGDPDRRRLLELLGTQERTPGDMAAVIQEEFGLSQPAVSQHLKVLRDAGFATVRVEGTRRVYAIIAAPLRDVDGWVSAFRHLWTHDEGAARQ